MNIRVLSIEDTDQAYLLETEHTQKDIFYAFTKPDLLKCIKKQQVYGIFLKKILVGKVGLIDNGTKGFEVDGLVIHQDYRRKKMAKRLMQFAVQKLHQLKAKKAFLLTHPKNSLAISLYLQFGFAIDEWLPDKFGPGKHRIKMVKEMKREI